MHDSPRFASLTSIYDGTGLYVGSHVEGGITVTTAAQRDSEIERSNDPITTQVVRYALVSVAEQMKRTLVRTAFTSIVYELLDFAVGIYDRRIRLLGQACGLP